LETKKIRKYIESDLKITCVNECEEKKHVKSYIIPSNWDIIVTPLPGIITDIVDKDYFGKLHNTKQNETME